MLGATDGAFDSIFKRNSESTLHSTITLQNTLSYFAQQIMPSFNEKVFIETISLFNIWTLSHVSKIVGVAFGIESFCHLFYAFFPISNVSLLCGNAINRECSDLMQQNGVFSIHTALQTIEQLPSIQMHPVLIIAPAKRINVFESVQLKFTGFIRIFLRCNSIPNSMAFSFFSQFFSHPHLITFPNSSKLFAHFPNGFFC